MPYALIVDDDDDIRYLASLAMAEVGGFETELAASGQEALRMIQQRRPDVVLLDVMMPEMDGLETLHRLRQLPGLSDVPVLFISARGMAHELAELEREDVLGMETARRQGAVAEARRTLHAMHGTAGSFGLDEISRLAEQVGHTLSHVTATPDALTGHVSTLRRAVARARALDPGDD